MNKIPTRKASCLIAGAFFSLCFSKNAIAQEHIINQPQYSWLRLAEEQYRQGHYELAAQSAKRYLSLDPKILYNNSIDAKETARYYHILSQIKLQAGGVEDSASRFLAQATNPAHKQRVSYALGQYYFEKQQFTKAIPAFENVQLTNLNNDEIADLKFQLAYCYFTNKQFDKAAPLFEAVNGLSGRYANAGTYYHGLLAYNDGKYDEALSSFKKIETDPRYKSIVSFYVAEIYYFKGQKNEALDKIFELTKGKEKSIYDNELHLLAAQILFEEKRYGDALPYFEYYYKNVDKIRKEELYEIGYSYYQVHEWENAIEKFKPLSNSRDSLGQTAMYLLGDSYLKIDNKASARNAFGMASDIPLNKEQQEASLMMHGMLSYEMDFHNDAMNSFRTLFNLYPDTKYASEARTLLSALLLRTNDYEEAYTLLQQVDDRSSRYWNIYQKVTYGNAMQQLQEGNLSEAEKFLDLSLQQPVNKDYQMAAFFWKGDIAYRNGKYQDAYNYSKRFVDADDHSAFYISSQATVANANLNLGYAAMELNDYAAAQSYFNNVQRQESGNSAALTITAMLREADAHFMQKNFKEAGTLYDKVIAANTAEADYARLQKAIIAGIDGKTDEKIKILNQVIGKIPASSYLANARYEMGLTCIEEDKYTAAITALQPLLDNNTGKEYSVKAWMKTAFAYQQLNKDDKAMDAYKYIVVNYPASEEKTAAMEALRNLYIEQNKPEAYAALLKDNNISSHAEQSLDSTYYAAAETQIAASKWADAKKSLSSYLEKYPAGLFTTRAHYYLAESYFHLKEYDAALKEYDVVMDLPWNEFSENSAKNAATIAYNQKDFAKANSYYKRLRTNAMSHENLQLAYTGLMRTEYNQQHVEAAARYADTLSALPEADAKIADEVNFYKAKALQLENKHDEALAIYLQLKNTKNTTIADEAKYRIAEIYFAKDNMKEAEAQAAATLKSNSGNNYWVVRSYILLADIMTKQKDYFNAKATLQSIIKNAKYEDLKQEATRKLEEVKTLEKQQTKLSAE